MDAHVVAALKRSQDIQHMIDITSQHLDRLRSTFSNASDELTKQEIRTLEGKLVKHFSEQLAVKYGLGSQNSSDFVYFPSLSQWLQVVGVSEDTKDAIQTRVRSLEDLKDKTECELKRILLTASRVAPNVRHEDLRRLCRSLHNLRKYTDVLVYGSKMYGPGGDPTKLELYWDSWDMTQSKSECSSPKHTFSLPPRLVHISSDDIQRSAPLSFHRNPQSRAVDSNSSSLSSGSSSAPPPSPGCSTLSPPSISESMPRGPMTTPPTTPPWAMLTKDKKPGPGPPIKVLSSHTPPINKKHSNSSSQGLRDLSSISKSKSHESELGHRVDLALIADTEIRLESGERMDSSGYSSASEAPNSSRRRLPSSDPEGSQSEFQGASPMASPKSPLTSSLQVPRSPRTPGTANIVVNRPMTHMISHRFTKTFKPARCMYCQEIFFQGMKCKECKFRCHTHCQNLVPPSCGLPEDLLQHFMDQLASEGSPILPRSQPPSLNQPLPMDSSSSSCNSSTPSSPQVIVTSHPTPPWALRSGHHFHFPDTAHTRQHQQQTLQKPQVVERVVSPNPLVDTVKSNDSDKTLSGSSDSIGTAYRLDSQDSTTSVEGDAASTWSSGRQASIREWDIPFEELKIGDKIGSGRFSTVHMGNWHGDVAIKFLDMENTEDETTLEAFRLDVATFRKTRHENLVLFMGACMNPPKLAIVTSLCKGNTLYTHLHLRKDKFFMNKVIVIAQQIATGMGYLHHKGIVHKDLKTKNIFLEKGRAIIADFGLVNVARRLCSRHRFATSTASDCMSIPAGWLCYLAPEVIRELRVQHTNGEDLPFTRASDVYAFGTVWYELLTGEWPWKQKPPESIIWQVGLGIKPTLANLQASRDVKDILVQCWYFEADQRPNFFGLLEILNKLPKKRLARSPSHPIHLSRSAESVF